jgi:hypothetical protein
MLLADFLSQKQSILSNDKPLKPEKAESKGVVAQID